MNVCKFPKNELHELDQIVKKDLREKNMLGRQASDEHHYMKRDHGRRGLKSTREVYKKTKVRVACYMAKLYSIWIQATWQ